MSENHKRNNNLNNLFDDDMVCRVCKIKKSTFKAAVMEALSDTEVIKQLIERLQQKVSDKK